MGYTGVVKVMRLYKFRAVLRRLKLRVQGLGFAAWDVGP